MIVLLWILAILVVLIFFMLFVTFKRMRVPMAPEMTPGDLGESRKPEYFTQQQESFLVAGFIPGGDFVWHEGLSTMGMRCFLRNDGDVYAWAVEKWLAGSNGVECNVTALTQFKDGALLDTTTKAKGGYVSPPWFLRETAVLDTELLLRRHQERIQEQTAQGKEINKVDTGTLLETITHHERRISQYQIDIGRMRGVGDKLAYGTGRALLMAFTAFGQLLSQPFRRRGAR